jgi:hypothetical protein
MSSHYDRNPNTSDLVLEDDELNSASDGKAVDDAAAALREVEVEAVRTVIPEDVTKESVRLDGLSIDQLRSLAVQHGVPNCGQNVERRDLIAAIRQCL